MSVSVDDQLALAKAVQAALAKEKAQPAPVDPNHSPFGHVRLAGASGGHLCGLCGRGVTDMGLGEWEHRTEERKPVESRAQAYLSNIDAARAAVTPETPCTGCGLLMTEEWIDGEFDGVIQDNPPTRPELAPFHHGCEDA